MTTFVRIALIPALAMSVTAQSTDLKRETTTFDSTHRPRFEDFPADETWKLSPAELKLVTHSERMFKTRLTEAAKEPANFAGHYRVTFWGCGSECSAGALVDLKSGDVIPPPLAKAGGTGWERWIFCAACFEGADHEFHVNSRLMIVRCGLNFSERLHKNVPDTYYFVLEHIQFRQLFFISGKESGR